MTQVPATLPVKTLDKDRIVRLQDDINLKDTNSIIGFGTKAQSDMQKISHDMLEGVRSKDTGAAGDSIRTMVSTLRGFSVNKEDGRSKQTFLEKLMRRAAPLVEFKERYTMVRDQIDSIAQNLKNHQKELSNDIKNLDMLYETSLSFYDEIAYYISAGDERLKKAREIELPALQEEMNQADEEDKVIKANEIRDFEQATQDLERRIHDLRLTRQVIMQSLPSIRLVQENDKSLVSKIDSTLVNTLPLWEMQLAQSLTINRSKEAATAVKEATDLTNQLLVSNADNLRIANTAIRTEAERGVFDIAAVEKANTTLLATLEDSLRIADEGKKARAQSEEKLVKMEGELRTALLAASAKKDGDARA